MDACVKMNLSRTRFTIGIPPTKSRRRSSLRSDNTIVPPRFPIDPKIDGLLDISTVPSKSIVESLLPFVDAAPFSVAPARQWSPRNPLSALASLTTRFNNHTYCASHLLTTALFVRRSYDRLWSHNMCIMFVIYYKVDQITSAHIVRRSYIGLRPHFLCVVVMSDYDRTRYYDRRS